MRTAEIFASTTRLSKPEVTGLSLARYATRYPPFNSVNGSYQQAMDITVQNPWILIRNSRYCPHCLAGDGSAIQQQHGGAWRQQWRFAIVFACPLHRCLLRHLCPSCGAPAFQGNPRTGGKLIPQMSQDLLHPAKCRHQLHAGNGTGGKRFAALCEARLDLVEIAPDVGLSPLPQLALDPLLQVQQRISTALDLNQNSEHQREKYDYLKDMIFITSVLQQSWPEPRHLLQDSLLAELIDDHVERSRQELEDARRNNGRLHRTITMSLRGLPSDTAVTAGLMYLADQITEVEDADLSQIMNALTQSAFRQQPRRYRALRDSVSLSARMGRALMPQFHGFGAGGAKTPPAMRVAAGHTFGVQHVPQLLPKEQRDRFMADLIGVRGIHLRRAAAFKLIERAAGITWIQAAELLDTPRSVAGNALQVMRTWARDPANLQRFQAAVEEIATEIDHAPVRVDYAERRRVLRDWVLSDSDWTAIVAEARQDTSPVEPDWGPVKQMAATIFIWTHATQGDYRLAPQLRRIRENGGPTRRVFGYLRHLVVPRLPTHHVALRHHLRHYADLLVSRVDRQG